MAKLQPCEKAPEHNQLAFYSTADTIDLHREVLGAHDRYWAKLKRDAEARVDIVSYDLGGMFLSHFQPVLGEVLLIIGDKALRFSKDESTRRKAMAALGMSVMLRRMLRLMDTPLDARGSGQADVIPDLEFDEAARMPYEPGLHVPPEVAESILPPIQYPEEWYYGSGLYVRRTQPAEPHKRILKEAAAHGVRIESQELVTMSPFIPSMILSEAITSPVNLGGSD